MAQQLRAQDQRVALLALIEPSSPPAPSQRPYLHFAGFVFRRVVRRFGHHLRNFLRLESAEKQAYLRLKSKLFANIWALACYTPQRYPDRVTLFMSTESLAKSPQDPRLRWRDFADGGLELQVIPGNHDTITGNNETIIEEAHMQVLAEKLKVCIDQVRAS
jgi:thioesterase domain-containing protein